jgi:hypothetical protein
MGADDLIRVNFSEEDYTFNSIWKFRMAKQELAKSLNTTGGMPDLER